MSITLGEKAEQRARQFLRIFHEEEDLRAAITTMCPDVKLPAEDDEDGDIPRVFPLVESP